MPKAKGMAFALLLALVAGASAGAYAATKYFQTEPDVTCTGCHWQEVNEAGACVKNCER